MGIQQLRQSFTDALGAAGTLATLTAEYVRHDEVESQIITASGTWADGTPFVVKSDRLRAGTDLVAASAELARRALENRKPLA